MANGEWRMADGERRNRHHYFAIPILVEGLELALAHQPGEALDVVVEVLLERRGGHRYRLGGDQGQAFSYYRHLYRLGYGVLQNGDHFFRRARRRKYRQVGAEL